MLYSRDNGDSWILAAADRGFQADRYAYYPSACVMPDDSIFMVGDHQGFPNDYGQCGAEVVATRFRIRPASGEDDGIELLPIPGSLHPPWGSEMDAGTVVDERLGN